MIPLPDLLHDRPFAPVDDQFLAELLESAFLGRNESASIDARRGEIPLPEPAWNPTFFGNDLFLAELFAAHATVSLDGRDYAAHLPFVTRVIAQPPLDAGTVRFRQRILEELEADGTVLAKVESLYAALVSLVDQIKATYTQRLLDQTMLRLDTLRQARAVVDSMVADFAGARSGLRRIHEVGREIQRTDEHEALVALLDYEDDLTRLDLKLRLGADGRIRNLEIAELQPNISNPYYLSPLRRWIELARMRWQGVTFTSRELVNRVILEVYRQILPSLSALVQLLGHLEVYVLARAFARRAREAGLEVCLATVEPKAAMRLDNLFNPLLLHSQGPPVPCTIAPESPEAVVVVTGPNSGGKTRLLQAIGIAQLLGQSGLYVPASRARLPLGGGMFASLVHQDRADLREGRLGTELLRIRTLFQGIAPRSVIFLDELCSGTNPSEAAEIVAMVLRLLRKLSPLAFVTTHFLDLAHDLAASPPIDDLEFLQVEVNGDQSSTYQFVPGVATSSLAVGTARRLGVDFERLAEAIDARLDGGEGGT